MIPTKTIALNNNILANYPKKQQPPQFDDVVPFHFNNIAKTLTSFFLSEQALFLSINFIYYY